LDKRILAHDWLGVTEPLPRERVWDRFGNDPLAIVNSKAMATPESPISICCTIFCRLAWEPKRMENPEGFTWPAHSSLFTVRVWREALGDQPGEVRMQIRHVLSGETRYFRTWVQVVEYLEGKLSVEQPMAPVKREATK
jgi:hypothetical protein